MDYTPLEITASSPSRRHWYHATFHIVSVLSALTLVTLFPLFAYRPWSLSTAHSLKTTQQYLNFVVIGIALLTSMLMSYCLIITNDAEVQAEFVTKTLSLARLHTRSNVARQEITSLIRLAKNNRSLWGVSAPYAIAFSAFSGISWVLSLLFVLDSQISSTAQPSTVNLILGGNIPSLPDPCRSSLTAAKCTYDLATSALTSQLITHTPFTIANVTFSGPVGTQGLPIGAMNHFAGQASTSRFGNELSQYCLPVLKPKLVSCTPVQDDSRAKYVWMSQRNDTYQIKENILIPKDTYEVIINPSNLYNQTYVVTSSNYGVMAISRSKIPEEITLTVVTGSGQYADLLSRLSTGQPTPYANGTYNETIFTLLCDVPYNKIIYTWQWITFSLDGGVMTTTSTNDTCRQNTEPSPFAWLDYTLEEATSINNIGDGYSKLINTDYLATSGADFDRMKAFNMSPLEYILSHLHAIVNTAWSATNNDIAKTTSIDQKSYAHRNVITVELKGVTAFALCVACVILLSTIWHSWRWTRAIAIVLAKSEHGQIQDSQDGQGYQQWQLLEPLQLLAYGSAAAKGVSKLDLTDHQQRIAVLRNRHGPVVGCGPGTLLPSTTTEMEVLPSITKASSSVSTYGR